MPSGEEAAEELVDGVGGAEIDLVYLGSEFIDEPVHGCGLVRVIHVCPGHNRRTIRLKVPCGFPETVFAGMLWVHHSNVVGVS